MKKIETWEEIRNKLEFTDEEEKELYLEKDIIKTKIEGKRKMKAKNRKMKKFQANEELRRDIIEKLKQAEAEIERGEGIEAEVVFKEWRQKYGY